MAELVPYRRVHVIGAGGAGMSGLAKLLAQAGHQVTGSDLKPSRLLAKLGEVGVETWTGHRPQLAGEWDLVVASSAVPGRDPEVAAARQAGVEVWERPQLLGALTRQSPALGITGTHGKTTTTALMIAAFHALGRDPTFLVGGELADLNTNAHLGERDLFLLEADEAFGTFLELEVGGLIVTNIEADHLDHYGDLVSVEESFAQVAASAAGPVLACIDDPGARRLASRVEGVIGYGTSDDARWRIDDVAHSPAEVSFVLRGEGEAVPVTVGRPGLHVARNAAGVVALLATEGLDTAVAAVGLERFGGVRRRFEVRSRIGGVTVIDDYAHHPTEVAATLQAALLSGAGRVIAVFQPHRYTRTAEHATAFGAALAEAAKVIVTDVYAAGEAPIPGVSGRLVAEAARQAGAEVDYVALRSDLAPCVAEIVGPDDLVLLMGAGDITLVADELPALLENSR